MDSKEITNFMDPLTSGAPGDNCEIYTICIAGAVAPQTYSRGYSQQGRKMEPGTLRKNRPKNFGFFLALKTRFFFRKNKLYLFKLKKLKFFIYKKGSRGAAPGPPKIGAICDQRGARMDEAWVDLGGTSYE